MEEKVLKGKKTGFPMLLLFLGLYTGAILLTVFSAMEVDKDQQVFGHVTHLTKSEKLPWFPTYSSCFAATTTHNQL